MRPPIGKGTPMSAKGLASAAFALAVGACSFEPALTAKIVDYNRVVEDTGNSLLLLNVLRAKDRKPFYLTTLSQFNPTIGSEVTGGVTVPFNPAAYTTLSLNTSGRINSSNQATVAVEGTQKFMLGFTKPIDTDLFNYFFQQGWPYEILFHLFVHKIEAVKVQEQKPGKFERVPKASVYVYLNAPVARTVPDPRRCPPMDLETGGSRAWHQFECFQELLRDLQGAIRFGTVDADAAIGPVLQAGDVRKLEALTKVAELKLELKKVNGGYQLSKPGKKAVICLSEHKLEPDDDHVPRSSAFECHKGESSRGGVSTAVAPPAAGKNGVHLGPYCGGKAGDRCEFVFHLRSPEAMLYYLGEVVRADHNSDGKLQVRIRLRGKRSDEQPEPLFVARKLGAGASYVSVTYDGQTYVIPKSSARSMQVLSLLTILIALQREATELPRTTTVNVVGQ